MRHAGVVWGGVGGVLFFVAACWGVLPGVGVCSGVCGGGLRTQERVLYYFYAYMFCKLWSD